MKLDSRLHRHVQRIIDGAGCKRLAALKEIGTKVSATIMFQPFEQTDPRFKKYW